jgi:hypothetical protein
VTPVRTDWDPAAGPARLCAELERSGMAWVRAPELADAADREPWAAAERLLGERPLLLERQPIRAVAGGRSFSAGHMAAPLHTDSQTLLGAPPHVQVMACRAAAASGGECLFLDTWALLARIEAGDPDLFARLFDRPRRFPFVFGDVFSPTVSLRRGSLVFTHTACPLPDDRVAPRLQAFLDAAPLVEVRAEAGDVLVIHNHRVLHGRRAFEDTRRSFMRLLVWRTSPWPAPEPWRRRAEAAAVVTTGGDAPPEVQRRLGVVLELLRGVPPGVLSAREGVGEPELYRWRDAVLRGGAADLARGLGS